MNPGLAQDRLACRLHAHAVKVLRLLPPPGREACLPSVEAFVERPGPTTYLRAHHALSQALGAHLSEAVFGSGQTRAFADGIAALQSVAVIPETDMAYLERDLPVDALTGARLSDLATLLQIWRELAGRTDQDLDRLRALRQMARGGRPKTLREP